MFNTKTINHRKHLTRQFSIFTIVISITAIFSVLIGGRLLYRVSQSSDEITKIHVPAIEKTNKLSLLRAEFTTKLGNFINAKDKAAIKKSSESLTKIANEITTITEEFSHHKKNNEHSVTQIENVGRTLTAMMQSELHSLKEVLLASNHIQETVQTEYLDAVRQIDAIQFAVDKASVNASITTYQLYDKAREAAKSTHSFEIYATIQQIEDANFDVERLAKVLADLKQLQNLLLQSYESLNSRSLLALRNKTELLIRDVIRETANTDKQQKTLMPRVRKLHDDLFGPKHFFDNLAQAHLLKNQARDLERAILDTASILDSKILDVVNNANNVTQSIAKEVSSISSDIFRIYTVSILGILFMFYFMIIPLFYSHIIKPLHMLATQTKQLSEGKLNIAITPQKSVELGDVSDALVVFRDNAIKLEESQSALLINNSQLKNANEDLEQFAAIASHDLRTPLRGIANLTDFVKQDLGDDIDDIVRENLDSIEQRTRRLELMLDELLTYSKLNKKMEHWEEINVEEVALDAFNIVNTNPSNTLEVHCHHKGPMVAAKPAVLQIFRNLFDNSIKYCDSDGVKIHVAFSADREFFKLDISDNGIGIESQYHEKIFKPFQRLTSKDDIDGIGLGLSMLKRITESAGGSISVAPSAEDKNSSHFVVYWPRIIKRIKS